MQCPVCRAPYRPSSAQSCRRCGLDLSPLITLHDQALWYHRQALESFRLGAYSAATHQNQQALALVPNQPDFQSFAGQLWAIQGMFTKAIAAWEKALQLNPQHPTAGVYLQGLQAFSSGGKVRLTGQSGTGGN